MQYQINIGLEIPGVKSTKADIRKRANYVKSLLSHKFAFVKATVKQSATEATVVASFHTSKSRVYPEALAISDALQRDCVAVYCPSERTGALIGRKAAEWGDFNKDYFIEAK